MSDAPRFLIPPRLETARLHLRPFAADDWRALHEYYSDAECVRYTFRRPQAEAGTWRAMAGMAGQWLLRGYGPYAIEGKAGGEVLGVAGLWYPLEWPEPEIKWALARRHWGQGYASEAARAVRDMAARCLPALSLISLIDCRNAASIRVALALGARFERNLEFGGEPFSVYRHGQRPAGKAPA